MAKIDELYWDLSARTDGLEADIQRAQARLKSLDKVGQDAAGGLEDIGKAGSAALSGLRSDLRETAGAIESSVGDAFEGLGRKISSALAAAGAEAGGSAKGAADVVLDVLNAEFERGSQSLAENLTNGIISRNEFRNLSDELAKQFNAGLETGLETLKDLGVGFTERTKLVSAFKQTGKEAGEEAGRGFAGGFTDRVKAVFTRTRLLLVAVFAGVAARTATELFKLGASLDKTERQFVSTFGAARGQVDETIATIGRLAAVTRGEGRALTAETGGLARSLGASREEAAALAREVFAVTAAIRATREVDESFAATQNRVTRAIRGQGESLESLGIAYDRTSIRQQAIADNAGKAASEVTKLDEAFAGVRVIARQADLDLKSLEDGLDAPASAAARLGATFRQVKENIAAQLLPVLSGVVDELDRNSDKIIRLGATLVPIGQILTNAVQVVVDGMVVLASGAVVQVQNVINGAIRGFNRLKDVEFLGIPLIGDVIADVDEINFSTEALDIHNQARFNLFKNTIQGKKAIEQFRAALRGEIDDTTGAAAAFSALIAELRGGREATTVLSTGIGDTGSAAAAARERLAELHAAVEELRQTGARFTLLDAAPQPLREAVAAALDLRAEIRGIEEDIFLAGGASAEVLDLLQRKREQLDQARARAADIANSPEGRIEEAALRAREGVEDLLAARERLTSLGFDGLADAPPQLLAVFEKIGENEATIARIAELTGDLAEEDAELAAEAAALIARIREENAELQELAGVLTDMGAILEAFPDFEEALFKGLRPAEIDLVRGGLESIAAAQREVEVARRELDLAEIADDSARAQRATIALARAEERLAQTLKGVAAAVEASNLPLEIRNQILDLIRKNAEGAGEAASKLAEQLGTLEGLARGVLSVADAMGLLDDNTRRALQGVVDIAAGLGRISQGDLIGGGAQAIGGAVNFVTGLFGEDPETKRQREALRQALDRLRGSIERFAASILALPANLTRSLTVARDAAGSGQRRKDIELFGGLGPDFGGFVKALQAQGLTGDDIRRIGEQFGLTLDDLAAHMDGATVDTTRLGDEIEALIEAMDVEAVERFFNSFEGKFDLLQREFDILDIDDPIEKLKRMRELFKDFVDLPADLQAQLDDADLSTPEGRAAFEAALEEAFRLATQSPDGLLNLPGGLSPTQFLDFLGNMEALLDQAQEGDAAGLPDEGSTIPFEVRKAITELSANRLIGQGDTAIFQRARMIQLLEQAVGLGGPAIGTLRAPPGIPSVGPSAAPTINLSVARGAVVFEGMPVGSDGGADLDAIEDAVRRGLGRGLEEALEPGISKIQGYRYRRDLRSTGGTVQ